MIKKLTYFSSIRFYWSQLFVVVFVNLVLPKAFSEPWIANRFAQNCAACHAPGRKNVKPAQRRCTLACQGCHVNPNGGGLRSFYGKWNENRWLASIKLKYFQHQDRPHIYRKQHYAKYTLKKNQTTKHIKKPHKTRKHNQNSEPPPLITTQKLFDEKYYDRSDQTEHIIANSHLEFLQQIPKEDPYYEKFNQKIDGGADIRWQMQQGERKLSTNGQNDQTEKIWTNFLMSADLALRWRPVYKRYHLVYEGRYFGNPVDKEAENQVKTLSRRSLYFLIDDLPFATYVMAGYYRPLFGYVTADHTMLNQKMQSYALQNTPNIYNLSYQAVSLGGSPNVPFANVHYLGQQLGSEENKSHQGLAVNVGGRFVTLGASVMYSFWHSKKDETIATEDVTTTLQMHSLNLGMHWQRFTLNSDILVLTRDRPNDSFIKGGAATIDSYIRLWREIYAQLQYAQSNIAINLKPGAATQWRAGLRAFVWPGVESSLLWSSLNNKVDESENTTASTTDQAELLWQLHLFM